MSKNIFIVKNKLDLERCFSIMQELRPHLTFESYISIYEESNTRDGYEIVAIEQENKILALMGYRFLWDYVRGKHVYIDDLVVTEKRRSSGLGAELLKFAEDVMIKNNCTTLRLCTGINNHRGILFYDKNGWSKKAYAYVKNLGD